MCVWNIQGAGITGSGKIKDGSDSHLSAYSGLQKQNLCKRKVNLEWMQIFKKQTLNKPKVNPKVPVNLWLS